MAASSRRAVITGVGVLSPIGLDAAAFWRSLQEGKSGVHPIQAFDASSLPVRFAGEIADFDPKNYVEKSQRKGLRMMARTIQLAVGAAQLALQDAGVDKTKLVPERFGVEFGAGLIATELPELADASRVSLNGQANHIDLEKWGAEGLPLLQPLWMLKYLPNMLASHVSILHDARGPNNSITEGDASSLLALGEAYRILGRGQADLFLVGGAESKINPLSLVRQCLYEPLSRRNDAPEKASRPFERNRDGLVVGEGAAVFALEELEHAKKRSARIYGEVVGFGAAFSPDLKGDGLARAVRAALKDAGIGPEQVDHVNAHGLSARESDEWEARNLQSVFGDVNTPVVAVKSYIGNLGAAGGTTEMAASVLGFHHGEVPRTLNYDEPDPACPIPVAAASRVAARPYAVKVGFTQMGQCAAVVIRKWN
ncbi:MAG TPA: beta-ketoacyl synthase N-terminal-like domain-containing protein [Gemmataceae bacterium]|nr:beta-ketoacyl synthase N-terminal-like domain-containing protein [Gemmataceae bacterium]